MQQINHYVKQLLNGDISRRGFIRRLSALGLSLTAIGGILRSAPVVAAQSPKYGGLLRAVHSAQSPNDTLDPQMATAGIDACRAFQFYNSLVWVNEKLEPIPELAVSWETKPGAKEWHFKLRKDVEYSNGKKFTSADVIYTMSRIIAKDSKSPAKSLFGSIEDMKADGDHGVIFFLKDGNMDLPSYFTDYHTCIVPEGFTDFNNPVGTGPFVLKEFVPGVRSLAARKKDYFKNGQPYVDELEWFAITDASARVNALMSGDVHMILELDPKALKSIEKKPDIQAVSTPAGQYIDIVMMCDRAPTDNNDLRLGMKYLIDRERVVKSIYKGFASIGNDTPVAPTDPFYCDQMPIRPFDLDKAKYHIKKSGVTEIDLHTSEACGTGAVEEALMIQQMGQKIGFKVNVKRDPADGYWDSTWMKFPVHMSGWSAKATADIMLSISLESKAPWNESQWKNDAFDQLLAGSRIEVDQAKRKAMYCEMQQLLYDTGGIIIPAFNNFIDGISSNIKGLVPLPLAGLGGLRFHETVWLSS